jgi:glucose-6-phosphate dehydrogenase assembly protein OpcA
MSEALPAEKILHDLANLWVSQGRQAQTEEGAGVLRACTMTLVVLAEEGDDVSSLGETIAALMPQHPARAIVIRLNGAAGGVLEQRVYAQCWKPFGQRRQICCEQIEIMAPDRALAGLPWVVLPLAVPDLPLIVWCRSARLLAREEFAAIAALARKVVVDSKPMGSDTLRTVAGLIDRGGPIIGDLSWTRLTRWREVLAQVFENRENLARLAQIEQVSVDFVGEGPAVNWYMGAWILDVLNAAGAHARLTAGDGQNAGRPALSLEGPGFHLEMARRKERLVISCNGLSSCTSLPPATDYLLMREELEIVRHDPIFERTVASALRLAYANHR